MEEKSLHLQTLERLKSALESFDTSFILSNKLFRLALVSEILDASCMFEQLYNSWSEKLPIGEGPDADVTFELWKEYSQWKSLVDNAQQAISLDDITIVFGNGLSTNDITGNRRKSYRKNLSTVLRQNNASAEKNVLEFFKILESDNASMLTYGNMIFGALQVLLAILSKINRLLNNPPEALLASYTHQQKERFSQECSDALSHINQICSSSLPSKRKCNQLREYCDQLKEKLIESGFLIALENEFTKYDIDDYRNQIGDKESSDEAIKNELALSDLIADYKEGKFHALNPYLFNKRRELSRESICSFFVYAEMTPVLRQKIVSYSSECSSKNETKTIVNEKYPFVKKQDGAEIIIEKIKNYQEGKDSPKDLCMPLRAAIDAGVIRRPSHSEYTSVIGFSRIHKSSLSEYTNPDKNPYFGEAYNTMVEDFAKSVNNK